MNISYTITGPIDNNIAHQLIAWVNSQITVNTSQAITHLKILLSSSGGDVDSAIRIYFYLKALPFEVEVIAISQIDSVANIIFLAGSKRKAIAGCRFFLHNITFNVQTHSGYLSHFREVIRNFEEMEKRHTAILSKELKLTKKQVQDILQKADFYTCEEAYKMGLASEIINKL